MNRSAPKSGVRDIDGKADLLAHALALELEASERYAELAEQMESHNNVEVAELFRELSRIEKLHVDRVRQQGLAPDMQNVSAASYRWESPEGPETADMGEAHYLMTPHHALKMALLNEQRAHEFFARIAVEAKDPELAGMAAEMAAEEQEHVELVRAWLGRYPEPDDDWSDDHDPPDGRD